MCGVKKNRSLKDAIVIGEPTEYFGIDTFVLAATRFECKQVVGVYLVDVA